MTLEGVVLLLAAALSPVRPYEFEWADRTRDEFPPVLRLERADGWRVVASNAGTSGVGLLEMKMKGQKS